MKKLLQKILLLLFPGTCILCGLPSRRDQDLCRGCEQDLPWKPSNNNLYPTVTHQTVAVFEYKFPVQQLIVRLKFANKLVYGKVLGELMASYLANYYRDLPLPQVIIPVPLHKKRYKERGYNQSLELAVPIASIFQLPLLVNACIRTKNTKAQSKLSESKRNKNIRGAFVVAANFNYNYVAIVDDVVTTGATIIELCRELKKSGVTKIDVWCCAKTR